MDEVITSRNNARVKQLRAAFAGQTRLADGQVAIEGDHLLEEAFRSGQVVKTIFVIESRSLPTYVPRSAEVVRLGKHVFESCVQAKTPQGLAALVVPPVFSVEEMLRGVPLIVIAVNLQDPGNLGTLIRSAEAFGATGMLTTMGTASAWNQKSLRASAGSVFRMPIAEATPTAVEALRQARVRLLAAVKDDAVDISCPTLVKTLRSPCGLLVGNEGAGLHEDWLRAAEQRVTVPCPGPVESLNAAVAGSILLWEIFRRRRTDVEPS